MGLFPCQTQSCEIVLGFVADSSEATGLKWQTPAASVPANASATVDTSQGTTSDTFTDLATAGPAVTLTTGTKALVIVSAQLFNTSGAQKQAAMSYAVSGASTVSAVTAVSLNNTTDANYSIRASAASVVTLTAGSNTFTAKYTRTLAGVGTATFSKREIFVMNLA